MDHQALLVSIHCTTYNHEPYIRQCLEGFVMQKTNFRFEAIVHDDASTDGTAKIVHEFAEKYPDIIKPIFQKENQYSKYDGSIIKIMRQHTSGKYIAMCEGDDYWIDPLKLQKQVDFLESNLDYSLCFNSVYETYEHNNKLNHIRQKVEDREYSGLEWFKTRPSQTASFVYRAKILTSPLYNQVISNKKIIVGDIPLLLSCAHYGKLRGFSDVMSVYRHCGGWCQTVRNKEQLLNIANGILEYKIFGEDIGEASVFLYQRECISAFISLLKRRKKDCWFFLKASIKISIKGTIFSFYKAVNRRYV